jgi:hypothetical protein
MDGWMEGQMDSKYVIVSGYTKVKEKKNCVFQKLTDK